MMQNTRHPDSGSTKSPTVLVVEDDPAINRMLGLMLRGGGFTVVSAANGVAAIDRVNEHEPDLIVLDLEMPVMDGRKCYRELRSRGVHAPVIIVSAYEARKGQRELGAEAAIEKPFSPEQLVDTAERILAAVN